MLYSSPVLLPLPAFTFLHTCDLTRLSNTEQEKDFIHGNLFYVIDIFLFAIMLCDEDYATRKPTGVVIYQYNIYIRYIIRYIYIYTLLLLYVLYNIINYIYIILLLLLYYVYVLSILLI